MTHGGEVGIVDHCVGIEPPGAEHRSHKWGDKAADVDEYIENLETRISLSGIFGIVVKLTHYGLQVAFEETVAEGYKEQGDAGESEKPGGVLRFGKNGNRKDDITYGHDYKALDDGAFVVLGFVGNGTADECEHIDAAVETRVDDS